MKSSPFLIAVGLACCAVLTTGCPAPSEANVADDSPVTEEPVADTTAGDTTEAPSPGTSSDTQDESAPDSGSGGEGPSTPTTEDNDDSSADEEIIDEEEPVDEGEDEPLDEEPIDETPAARGINPQAQLMITDLRVVEDPMRTNPANGDGAVWTFKYLMEQMAGTLDPSDFALAFFEHWETDQEINGFTSRARPAIRERIIDPWLAVSGGGQLDLARAPFKLLAIVNRMDLRVHDGSEVLTGGEGRFVFGALTPDGRPLPPTGRGTGGFLVIFEYELPAASVSELAAWAEAWDGLGAFPLGSAAYNEALEAVTRRFTDAGAAPGKVNGNAINQVRTNDQALGRIWELREFALAADTGLLAQRTVALTPDVVSLNGTPAFAQFINDGEAELLSGEGELMPQFFAASSLSGPFRPEDFPNFDQRTFVVIPRNGDGDRDGADGGDGPPPPPPGAPRPMIAPTMQNPPPPQPDGDGRRDGDGGDRFDVAWSAAGIRNNDARHALALNTCNGCHRMETRNNFTMVNFADEPNRPAMVSALLRGTEVRDPVDPETIRPFNFLRDRREDLEGLLAQVRMKGAVRLDRHVPNYVH